jgi:DNA-binding MarR family transcriptional regulator
MGKKKPSKPAWTFLSNHAHVLLCLHSQPELSVREIATRVGITERAVLRIISELEEEGYLTRARVGRRNQYSFALDKQLRHPLEAHRKIKALLDLI